MRYNGRVFGANAELSVEREGIRLGARFLDYADVAELRPVNHRVYIFTIGGEQIEIAMLGFSFDGFWEELTGLYADRCLEALFVEEERIMLCEGEFEIPGASGRGKIALYPDAVCVLPANRLALRIPLCSTREIAQNGYTIRFVMASGASYYVGKMGYDTNPFAERTVKAADLTKKKRAAAMSGIPLSEPFNEKGLFRTEQTDLYRFSEPRDVFLSGLRDAMEAVGTHRELIWMSDEQIAGKPLCKMAVASSDAVCYLRQRSDGRLIHNAGHSQRLAEYLDLSK